MATRFHWVFLFALFLALAPLSLGQPIESLHTFDGTNGAHPSVDLFDASFATGDPFMGATYGGGISNLGTIFQIQTDGIMNFPFSFTGLNGSLPSGNLVKGSNNLFYGTTQSGGQGNAGTIFKTSGGFNVSSIFSFAGTNGAIPVGLVRALDGYIYGATLSGGISNRGTIYRFEETLILPPGASIQVTTLHHFTVISGARTLMRGADGVFYGTTALGGDAGLGTVFKMTTNGVLTTLASFNGTNGAHPLTTLVQASDGNFYGTTAEGGAHNSGTIFRMGAAGDITTLASFDFSSAVRPRSLMLAEDGNFYGTTATEGLFTSHGTIFTMAPNGKLTTLATFSGNNGSGPITKLIERSGYLYGTTAGGGLPNPGLGTFFRMAMPVSLTSRVSGNELVLSWRTNAVGFTLQSSADLNSSTNWMDFTNAPAVVGAQFTVTNSISASAQFYRLRKP
jgi:uncharacterized repeat protein (TIGR03803 family)